jgi:hypothetical protein
MSAREARGRPNRRKRPPRDQHESAFTSILRALLARVPGARAAALVDRDGETVDYAGQVDPFKLRVAAAHWRIILHEAGGQPSLAGIRWVAVRAGRSSFLACTLPQGYALVVVLARAAGFTGWHRAVDACVRSLELEAGWASGPTSAGPRPSWFPIEVVCDADLRPDGVRVGGRVRTLEILAVAGPVVRVRRERGWRVRFDSGVEATLVREPGGVWYVDERIDGGRLSPALSRERSARKSR